MLFTSPTAPLLPASCFLLPASRPRPGQTPHTMRHGAEASSRPPAVPTLKGPSRGLVQCRMQPAWLPVVRLSYHGRPSSRPSTRPCFPLSAPKLIHSRAFCAMPMPCHAMPCARQLRIRPSVRLQAARPDPAARYCAPRLLLFPMCSSCFVMISRHVAPPASRTRPIIGPMPQFLQLVDARLLCSSERKGNLPTNLPPAMLASTASLPSPAVPTLPGARPSSRGRGRG